jgi:hypothetical protein
MTSAYVLRAMRFLLIAQRQQHKPAIIGNRPTVVGYPKEFPNNICPKTGRKLWVGQ